MRYSFASKILINQHMSARISPKNAEKGLRDIPSGNNKGRAEDAKNTCPRFAKIPEMTFIRSSVNSIFLICIAQFNCRGFSRKVKFQARQKTTFSSTTSNLYATISPMTIPKFQKTIFDWYKENRRNMPWRNTRDPYKILVSEVMLQQTQISRVLPKYEEFLRAFPTLEALAKALDKKLLKVWAGLGYWRRAKYLKETAKIITRRAKTAALTRRGGAYVEPEAKCGVKREEKPQFERLPLQKSRRDFEARTFGISSPEQLEKLPGIGPYTARAVACFSAQGGPASGGAFREAFLDTNIRRVYLHHFFKNKKSVSDKEILKIAQNAVDTLPKSISPREWHYALMDYGAMVLKDKKVNKRSRHYHKQSKFEGSFRSFRTKAVRFLLKQPDNQAPKRVLVKFLKRELQQNNAPYQSKEIIVALLKDRLIKKSQKFYSI